jgi:hypothetical protein
MTSEILTNQYLHVMQRGHYNYPSNMQTIRYRFLKNMDQLQLVYLASTSIVFVMFSIFDWVFACIVLIHWLLYIAIYLKDDNEGYGSFFPTVANVFLFFGLLFFSARERIFLLACLLSISVIVGHSICCDTQMAAAPALEDEEENKPK